MNVNLFNIQHFSTHDGPGIRTTVFFKGCPLQCAWCHNPEGKSSRRQLSYMEQKCVGCGKCETVCPELVHQFYGSEHILRREGCSGCGLCAESCNYGALEVMGRQYDLEEVMENIRRDALFFGDKGGVTLSGGEPFLQPEAAIELLRLCKEAGYHTCVETCGYTDPEHLEAAAPYVDLFLYDCKETDEERHKQYTGVGLDRILRNLDLLDRLGAAVILRCPIIPEVNQRPEHFEAVAELAARHGSVRWVELEPYHPLGVAKAAQLGMDCDYDRMAFLEGSTLTEVMAEMEKKSHKPVRLG